MTTSLAQADIVIGLQHGDEGKGKIVQWLIQNQTYDVCARFNGGPNAGHTIYRDGVKLATHGIPTGVVYNIYALIGPGCVIDISKLNTEIEYLEAHGVADVRSKVKIAHNAHLISHEAIEEDRKSDAVGTTLRGIGPTYARKALRINQRVDQVLPALPNLNGCEVPAIALLSGCEVVDASQFLMGKKILFEGAQGFELDPDWGEYPYVTSSSCLASQVLTCGIPYQCIKTIYGVCKIYDTYVGSKKFMPADDQDLLTLQVIGGEYGVTTGRARQCNWLNLDRLIKAIYINGVHEVIMNKCDIIVQLGSYQLYFNQKLIKFESLEAMKVLIEKEILAIPHCRKITFSASPLTI